MNYVHICPVGVIGGKEAFLTYHSSAQLETGTIVDIPFGKRTVKGVIIEATKKPTFKTREVVKVYDDILPSALVSLALWMRHYYAVHLSIVFQAIIPRGLEKSRRDSTKKTSVISRSLKKHDLTESQAEALRIIQTSTSITHLLHGVTGSGKTRIYQELATEVLEKNKSVLVLVPEISLTPQLAAEFEAIFEHVLVLHSGLTEAQRHTYWLLLSRAEHPWIVVGPRSILFSPLKNIGLIIIDECHEPSYVQDSQPKYSALRVARKLAELHPSSKLILGSATPLIADYFLAQQTKSPIISMSESTNSRSVLVHLVDTRERATFGNHPIFSNQLLQAMKDALAQNQQILLFHNRRGTARLCLCSNCGWSATCSNCHIPMRLHHDDAGLRCHTCGRTERLPQKCPDCNGSDILFKGYGSKRIEVEVKKLFPEVNIARFDSDTPEKEQLQHRYQELYDNDIKIIIGTQGVAKGLDLPHLTTVGVVQADSELFIPDFSSSERAFQLLTQVIGRAGRHGQASNVIVQTFNPEHPAIAYALQQDYKKFYDYEIRERKLEHVTPFQFMLQISTSYVSQKAAEAACQKMAAQLKETYKKITIRGPSPAFHERKAKTYTWQLILLSSTRTTLSEIAKNLPARWQFTLDPINLL